MYKVLSVTAKSYHEPIAIVALLVIILRIGTLSPPFSSKLETSTSKIRAVHAINRTSGKTSNVPRETA